ncbi:MAG: hypothetical protein C0582_04520 [Alphaproteobacteria bacterium]|nr:MAG: hypothetical protein C0582_04520 [Alphaproteobacteria bacterium]
MRSLVLLAALLLFIAPDLSAEMVINTVTLSGSDEKTYFILESNQKKPLKVKTEDTQGIKVELPEDVSWRAPLSNAAAQGLVEGYRMESGVSLLILRLKRMLKRLFTGSIRALLKPSLSLCQGQLNKV